MLLNVHSWYSLRYGTLSPQALAEALLRNGYDAAVLTDINNSTGVLEFIRHCRQKGLRGYAGMEFRNGDELRYFCMARNPDGFAELNGFMTACNMAGGAIPATAPVFNNVSVIYPFSSKDYRSLRDFEYIGIQARHLTKITLAPPAALSRYVVWQPVSFLDKKGHTLHRQLRAIHSNVLLSQLGPGQCAGEGETLCTRQELLRRFAHFPQIIANTERLLCDGSFAFDFDEVKNKKCFTESAYDDKQLLETLALDGWKERYGSQNQKALLRVKKELAIIHELGFSAYFLITWDIVRYTLRRGFYHVGRGSGANSVVAYCLKITDVCPMELDLYFERFLNPRRKSPPDFDVDYSWKDRDEVFRYIFKKYGPQHTALLGAISTFRDRSIIRELGKVYGLPRGEIDRLVEEPESMQNKHEVADLILSVHRRMADFPNNRSIHAGGVLISERPLAYYTALDLPPKGFATVQWDMYEAEAIGFEKLDILSQRGIGHIRECAEIVKANRGITVDVHQVEHFKQDAQARQQLASGDTIGCFYIESPAMRQLLRKLRCGDYLTLVAASSIIRPGVAKSGMMKQYIYRYHNRDKVEYLHPVMEEQLKETFGVMVYQEDVLKIGHHFGGLDMADADVLRRLMSGKNRGLQHQVAAIGQKFFAHCAAQGYDEAVSREVWRQMESFAGFSFSKAHSASYAVESYQSLYLKAHYPLEFITAVINNFGGFYPTRVYVAEAQKCGAAVHLPCVNNSGAATSICGRDMYLGLVHIQNLESAYHDAIPLERERSGPYLSLEDLVYRTGIRLEQLVILIRTGALRFTGRGKKGLLWEAYRLLSRQPKAEPVPLLFRPATKALELPQFESHPLEDAYDELELLGFPLSMSMFDMVKTAYRGDTGAKDLGDYEGRTVRMVGNYIANKSVRTVRCEVMQFGTFLDEAGGFFDTVHFPPSLRQYPFKGGGVYLIEGKVVVDDGFPTIEVDKLGKLPVEGDPRGGE